MPTLHIIGAGVAGLACALRLAGEKLPWRRSARTADGGDETLRIRIYEAAPQAGGRCRSFADPRLGREIDAGTHLLLGANPAIFRYLRQIAPPLPPQPVQPACYPYRHLETGASWRIAPGRTPLWLLAKRRRPPAATALALLADSWRLLRAPASATVASCLTGPPALLEQLWRPLSVSLLNAPPERASAALLARVLRRTFLRGGRACQPWLFPAPLSATLIAPACRRLRQQGVLFFYGQRLIGLPHDGQQVRALVFQTGPVALEPDDQVVLAVPGPVAARLLPGLRTPEWGDPIVNAHFRVGPAFALPSALPLLGLAGGVADWLFWRDDVLSVTISAAEPLREWPGEALLRHLWREACRALALPETTPQPPARLLREPRATFCATPDAQTQRPGPDTLLSNLLLAGDWTATGLPSSLEGAALSGERAAALVLRRLEFL